MTGRMEYALAAVVEYAGEKGITAEERLERLREVKAEALFLQRLLQRVYDSTGKQGMTLERLAAIVAGDSIMERPSVLSGMVAELERLLKAVRFMEGLVLQDLPGVEEEPDE